MNTMIRFRGRTTFKFAVIGALLGLFVTSSAEAAVVTLSFDGNYDLSFDSVFGQRGAAVPFHYDIVYDTSLDTNTYFFPSGVLLGGDTTIREWYGYSASGVVSTNLTFGTQTWTAADLVARIPAVGVSADLWFSADISVATPALCWIFFDGGAPGRGILQLGGGAADGTNIFMEDRSNIEDSSGFGFGFSNEFTITSDVQPVDSDGDGVPDSLDECADSDLSSTVILNRCDSGVPNEDLGNGCTTTDVISACDADNRYLQCVSRATRDLQQAGTITRREAGAIQSCAGRH